MTDKSPPRHWKGEPGNRHEHGNPWGHGGAKAPAPRAPWALTPEMVNNLNANRRNSDSSNSSQNQNNEPQSPQTVSERRRSSGSGAGLFSNLQSQKRDSSDAGMAGRRASWNEQREQGGFFSKLWDGYTRGK